MNKINHFLFALSTTLLVIPLSVENILFTALFSLIFSVFIDFDHYLNKNTPWYRRRTWIQEPFGFVIIGLPLAFLLSKVNEVFLFMIIIPYGSHIVLDYLCIFEAYPLAPFSRIKKREGLGIFVPNSKEWKERVKAKKIKAISENWFTLITFALFLIVLFKWFF